MNKVLKSILSVLIIFLSFETHAQENVIPIRVKDKFGLADINGKIVMKPQFDNMYPLGDNYFGYSNNHIVKDTIHWYDGRIEIKDKNEPETGLIHNQQFLIKGQKYPIYVIMTYLILGGNSNSYIEHAMLFNFEGEPLFKKDIATFEYWNPYHIESKDIESIILIKYEDKTFDVSAINLGEGKVKYQILENVKRLKITEGSFQTSILSVEYLDSNNNFNEKFIQLNNGKYVLLDQPVDAAKNEYDNSDYDISLDVDVEAEEAPDYSSLSNNRSVANSPAKTSQTKPVVSKPNIFSITNNKLTINGNLYLNELKDTFELIDKTKPQKVPVIYTAKNGNMGLLMSDNERSPAIYSHLQYIENQYGITIYDKRYFYYAGKKDSNGKMKYGIIGDDGKTVVPFVYDSIQINMKESYLNYDDKKIEYREPHNYSNKAKRILTISSSGFLDCNIGFMVGYKNGKCGLIGLDNKIYLSFDYEAIFKNGFSFTKENHLNLIDEFIIIKQADKYGIIIFNGNKEVKKIVKPIFPELPTRYYADYNQQQGLNIFVLTTGNNITYCYANENGKIYLEK
jgi:hypothetical protein